VPKKASSDTTELNITLTMGRVATWVVRGEGHHPLFRASFPLSVVSAGAPLTYSRPPLSPSTTSDPTWFLLPTGSSPSISSSSSPILNLDPSGSPLSFRSALSGPHRLQWLESSDNELIKLVETTRTLCPVYFALSTPTYFNPVAKEKSSPSSLFLPGTLRSASHHRCRR
jgi:hypothetical protein